MLDTAVVPDLKVVDDTLFPRERPHHGALLRGFDVLVRRKVVGHERDLLLVKHLGAAELGELADGDGRGDVVPQDKIQLRHDQLTRVDGRRARRARPTSGMRGEDLLRHRHAHVFASSMRFTATRSARMEPSITSVETPRPRYDPFASEIFTSTSPKASRRSVTASMR